MASPPPPPPAFSLGDRPDAIVFDFDGTIIDTEWPHYSSVRDEFALLGLELPLEEWRERTGRGDNEHWSDVARRQLGHDFDVAEAVERGRENKNRDTRRQALRPGVLTTLDHAARAGIPLAVASSSPRDWVEPHLERLGVRAFFAHVTTRDDVERAKPWPDLFEAAAAAIAVNPTAIVAIEDSHHGVVAAKAAGMTVIATPNPVTAGSDFDAADLVADSLAEVPIARLLGP